MKCGQALLWRRVGLFMLTKAGWRCWFSVHLIGLLSILLRCNGFAEIQKGIVTQMASRPPNSDHDLFFGARLALGNAFELLLCPTTEVAVAGCCMQSTFRCMSQSDQEMVCCCFIA